jgi:hypothetical protein
MQYGRERLWHEFRVAMPPSAGIPRFDQRADVTGIGVVALSLVLGRPLRDDEFPRAINDLLNAARERTALGEEQPLAPPLRSWLARALQVDVRRSFGSAPEALAALDEISADGSMYVAAPVALETFLSRYISALLAPPPPPAAVAGPRPVELVRPAPAPAALPEPPLEPPPPAVRDVTELLTEPLPAPLLESLQPEPLAAAEPTDDPDEDDDSLPDLAPAASATAGGSRTRWLAVGSLVAVLGLGVAASQWLSGGAPELATLSVESNPSGVPVFVDGVERGVTPTRLSLPPGAHILELRRGVPRVIPLTLTAGADVSQYLEFAETPVADAPSSAQNAAAAAEPPPAPVAPLAGWITAKFPFVVEIHEKGRLLGTTETDRIMLAAGAHELEFVNQPLGYRATQSVNVAPGKLTTVTLDLPHGVVNLNASPWAEVFLDGQRVGETPIGNLAVPIGPHEIVFRHPQFGERRHAVSVTAGVPVRVSVEMKQ